MRGQEPVTGIMTTEVITVSIDTRLSEVRRLMGENAIHHLPVVDGRRLMGIISYADILELSYTEFVGDQKLRDQFLDERCTVSALMKSHVITVSSHATVRDAARALANGRIHSVSVVDGAGHLSGIVTTTDLIRYLLD